MCRMALYLTSLSQNNFEANSDFVSKQTFFGSSVEIVPMSFTAFSNLSEDRNAMI